MGPLRVRASATAFTGSSGPPFTDPAQRQNAGRSVVTATRPPLTSHVILSPGPRSSASRTSFGTVVCPLLVMVETGIVRRLLTHDTVGKDTRGWARLLRASSGGLLCRTAIRAPLLLRELEGNRQHLFG